MGAASRAARQAERIRPSPRHSRRFSMRAHCLISPYLCAAIGLLGACSSSPTGPSETKRSPLPPGTTLVLVVAPSKTTIKNGQTFLLTASRESARGQSIAPTEIVWASSDLKVARIGSDGTVL